MCTEWRDLPNHTRMSTIQSRTLEKKAKNCVTLTRKLPRKCCSTPPLPFLSANPKILKAFLKTFPTKMKPTKCPAKKKQKWGKKSEKRGEERKWKVKLKTAEILLSAHTWTSQANIFLLDQKAAKCMTGLSLRAGGQGFSLATKRVAPSFFYWKIEEKKPKEIPSRLIPCLLVVFTRQLEILVTTLVRPANGFVLSFSSL